MALQPLNASWLIRSKIVPRLLKDWNSMDIRPMDKLWKFLEKYFWRTLALSLKAKSENCFKRIKSPHQQAYLSLKRKSKNLTLFKFMITSDQNSMPLRSLLRLPVPSLESIKSFQPNQPVDQSLRATPDGIMTTNKVIL